MLKKFDIKTGGLNDPSCSMTIVYKDGIGVDAEMLTHRVVVEKGGNQFDKMRELIDLAEAKFNQEVGEQSKVLIKNK